MCEFKVYLKNAAIEEKVAEDIVQAEFEEEALLLKDILGTPKRVQGVMISEVDVIHEAMRLQPLPLLKETLAFSTVYSRCEAGEGVLLSEVEARWEKVKARGDQLVSLLNSKRGG